MATSRARRLRRIAVVLAVAALGMSGSAWALAAGGDDDPYRQRAAADAAAADLSATSGVPCRMGYDTEAATIIPPDDSTTDNASAGTVTFSKKCGGAVVGVFSGEVDTPGASDFLHLDMRATCVGTGGFSTHCTVGQQVFGAPGHTFFQNGQGPTHDSSVQMVWSGLARGVWRFEVLPGGNGSANLQFRTFVVTAFSGG